MFDLETNKAIALRLIEVFNGRRLDLLECAVMRGPLEACMAGGAKRTKREEMLDEKRKEFASLSPQRDTGRIRQLEREIEYLEGMLR